MLAISQLLCECVLIKPCITVPTHCVGIFQKAGSWSSAQEPGSTRTSAGRCHPLCKYLSVLQHKVVKSIYLSLSTRHTLQTSVLSKLQTLCKRCKWVQREGVQGHGFCTGYVGYLLFASSWCSWAAGSHRQHAAGDALKPSTSLMSHSCLESLPYALEAAALCINPAGFV